MQWFKYSSQHDQFVGVKAWVGLLGIQRQREVKAERYRLRTCNKQQLSAHVKLGEPSAQGGRKVSMSEPGRNYCRGSSKIMGDAANITCCFHLKVFSNMQLGWRFLKSGVLQQIRGGAQGGGRSRRVKVKLTAASAMRSLLNSCSASNAMLAPMGFICRLMISVSSTVSSLCA